MSKKISSKYYIYKAEYYWMCGNFKAIIIASHIDEVKDLFYDFYKHTDVITKNNIQVDIYGISTVCKQPKILLVNEQ